VKCIVNDLDSNTFHTVDSGGIDEVRARSDDRLRAQIDRAVIADDGCDVDTFERDGEEFTVQVIVKR
jgi:hypothetical protein